PGRACQIARPGAAEIPHHAEDDRRNRRAEPRVKVEPADIFRLALGELGDQRLRSGPAERQPPPLTICNRSKGQNDGISGNKGAITIAAHTKNRVTRRVPKRSIKTPTWID